MSFLVGFYLGGLVVHCVVMRGSGIGFMLVGLVWPLLTVRAMVGDLLEALALPRCRTIIFDRMHGGTRQCKRRHKHEGLCE